MKTALSVTARTVYAFRGIMSRSTSLLTLEPATELKFRGPFTHTVTSDLVIKNPSNNLICFKVKTTAPKQYCVRPNGGFIEPGAEVKVQVILQPFTYDPNEKNRHKFLVQSIVCPAGSSPDDQDRLWKEAGTDQLMDAKLRCVFELPADPQAQIPSKAGMTGQTPLKRNDGGADTDMQRLLRDNSANRQKEMSSQMMEVPGSGFSRGFEAAHAPVGTNLRLVIIVAILSLVLGILVGRFVI